VSGPPLTIGTAGHVDHGKTALVRALTGKDTDRLPEEHQRGISIDLGFAPLDLPGGRRVSLVDVPGHERFVRTMVAGASGIDMFLMCVAADDGVMPQTREHAAVLRHLGVEAGVVAVTKVDAADPGRASAEAAELLPGATVISTSARAQQGLDELLTAMATVARLLPGRMGANGPTRLHIDRSFTLRGIGTVATGTLWAGSLGAGDAVEILPARRRARVRSVQVHDQPVERAAAGQRVAVALTGVRRHEVARGDVLAAVGSELGESYLIDAAVAVEPGVALERGTRLQVHHGTREAPARVVPLQGERIQHGVRGYAQLRLESALVCAPGDRLVLRRHAPPATVGGAVAVEVAARRHGPSAAVVERLRRIAHGEAPEPARTTVAETDPGRETAPRALVTAGLAARIAELLEADGSEPRPDVHLVEALEVDSATLEAGLAGLVHDGRVVRVGPAQHFWAPALDELAGRVAVLCRRQGSATIASVRDELGTSRKYAQAVLEHLDRIRVTRRDGDAHVLRRPTSSEGIEPSKRGASPPSRF
jgi:selenocysteine-specific elongation factor